MRRFDVLALCLGGLVVVAVGHSSSVHSAEVTNQGTAPSLSVTVENGFASVQCRNAALGDVLNELADQAGFELVISADSDRKVSWSFTDVATNEVLGMILRESSWIAIYASTNENGSGPLVKVHVVKFRSDLSDAITHVNRVTSTESSSRDVGENGSGAGSIASSNKILVGGNRDERVRALRRFIHKPDPTAMTDLALIATNDEDSTIRSMAVVGLGKLRTVEAKAALIAALVDRI